MISIRKSPRPRKEITNGTDRPRQGRPIQVPLPLELGLTDAQAQSHQQPDDADQNGAGNGSH